jgi:hypothetical protein
MVKQADYDVFLSYSHKDRPWVAEFASALREEGVTNWFDVSEIQAGERWAEHIQDALRASGTLVLVLSRNNVASPSTYFELGAAIAGHKRIIPVATEDVPLDQVPSVVAQYQMLKESSPREAGRRVAEVLQGAAA